MKLARRTERSRALILDAAEIVFREDGFDRATVEAIATQAGLTRKTAYNLFGSKEEIAHGLIARAEAVDTGYRSRIEANEDAATLLEVVLIDSANWCMANPSLARMALVPDIRPTAQPPADRPSFQGLVTDIVALGQTQGLIRRDEDAGLLALVLLSVFGQAMLSAIADKSMDATDIRKIIRLVLEGIGARGR